MTTRRSFLGAILAAAAAPAIIRSEILMPVRQLVLPSDPVAELRRLGDTTIVTSPGSLRVGDVITIAGVLGAGGMHRQFVVSQSSGPAILTIQPM